MTGGAPLVHIVTGGTGAGKTSYARQLASELSGVSFSIDDWMARLFWMDSPNPISFEWTMERIVRCEAQIRHEITALVRLNVPTVLDLGFTKAAHRAAFAEFALTLGVTARLHWIDIPANERWRRVEGRNRSRGETYALDVDRGMFAFMEAEWESPTPDEMAALNGQVVG